MNLVHRWICRSDFWRKALAEKILPWVLTGVELGQEVLEVGPGPGLVTDLLRPRLPRLTSLEIDPRLARSLGARLHGSNVRVIQGDATAMPFKPSEFSSALSCTMLHHVPAPELQDKLFAEVCRVLKPGGVFAGLDSLTSLTMRLFHINDTLVPVAPETLGARLAAAGFSNVFIETQSDRFRFHALKPLPPTPS